MKFPVWIVSISFSALCIALSLYILVQTALYMAAWGGNFDAKEALHFYRFHATVYN